MDAVALKSLNDPDETNLYVNELMKAGVSERPMRQTVVAPYTRTENAGNEVENTPKQRRLLPEIKKVHQERRARFKERLEVVDQRSIEMFVFNFASRTLAYK